MRLLVCFPTNQSHSEKESTLSGKNLLPEGAIFFPFRVGLVSEEDKTGFDRITSPESVSGVLKRVSVSLNQHGSVKNKVIRIDMLVITKNSESSLQLHNWFPKILPLK